MKISTVGSKFNNVHNPFVNKNLQQNTWWKTSVGFMGKCYKRTNDQELRTTTTIEVENKIIKHHNIKEHNLDLDKYLYERTKMLQANQLLVADKLINNK